MKNAGTIVHADKINSFELILACDQFEKSYPTYLNYTVRPGNDCIWISTGLLDFYYIFRDGKIVDVQID